MMKLVVFATYVPKLLLTYVSATEAMCLALTFAHAGHTSSSVLRRQSRKPKMGVAGS